jgi:hypothetical protein
MNSQAPADKNATTTTTKSWQEALWADHEVKFVVGTLRKVIAFVVVALSAVGLHSIIESLEAKNYPILITGPLTILEYAIMVADLAWILKYIAEELREQFTIPFHSWWLKALVVVVVFILGALSYPYVTPLIIELLKKLGSFLPR